MEVVSGNKSSGSWTEDGIQARHQSETGVMAQRAGAGQPGGLNGDRVWQDRHCRQAQDGHLGVTEELGDLPLTHGAHDGLPHGQLELLADDELHGLAAGPAVIQHGVLIVTVQRPVVERSLQATWRLGKAQTVT